MDNSEITQLGRALRKARQGTSADLGLLLEHCRGYLRLMARSHMQGRLRAKVDESDLVQQTMVDACQHWEGFRGQTTAELLGWLRTLLARNAIDQYRHYAGTAKRSAGREVPLAEEQVSSEGHAGAVLADGGSTPSQRLLREESEILLSEAMSRLPENYQKVLLLRSFQKLPFDAVADEMGLSRGAAQMLWARALKQLQSTYRSLDPHSGSR